MDSKRTSKGPSAKDVAAAVGVSISTVSLVLSGKAAAKGIPGGTAKRVIDTAAELGYRPNAIASGLRRQRTDTIGFVSDVIATTPHAGAMIQGAQDAALEAGKVLLIINTGDDAKVEGRAIESMLQRQVDGLVYATMYHRLVVPPPAILEVPAVLLDCRSQIPELPSVAPDEEGGARAATLHLLDAGHRRIGFIQSDASIPAAVERLAGYRSALESRGIAFDPSIFAAALDEYDGGFAATKALLGAPKPPSAIFCFNDRMAAGAVHAVRRVGLSVPRDLSLVGFDNEELVATLTDPPLTTIQLPHYEMGRWAVSQLLSLIAGHPVESVHKRMSCRLVARASVAHPGEGAPA